jgi:hypothetical protein
VKVGDLVKHRDEIGIYLGEKTFDGKYTCSMVLFSGSTSQKNGGPNPRPIQTDLLEVLSGQAR